MYTAKASLVLVALVAGALVVSAAGGIKGHRNGEESRPQGTIKGPQRPQQQAQKLPPPPAPQRPLLPQPIKGPGQVAPNFQPLRPQPAAQQQQQLQQQLLQQQQQQQQLQIQEAAEQIQQQQQESVEIDPNAAAQDVSPSVVAPAQANEASASEEEANPRPEPYSFQYAFESGDSATSGSSQREEQQDASGKVTGFYTLKGEDGRDRRVDYIADADGFRATITTNESGTAPKDSADVKWAVQAPTDGQLRAAESATQAARQRALLNPQPASSSSSASKVNSPRQNAAAAAAASQQQQQIFAASNIRQEQVAEPAIAQLQEPFEQIRQTELNARARKSRHAPFYLFTM